MVNVFVNKMSNYCNKGEMEDYQGGQSMDKWEMDFISRELRRLKSEVKNCKNKGVKNTIEREIIFLEKVLGWKEKGVGNMKKDN